MIEAVPPTAENERVLAQIKARLVAYIMATYSRPSVSDLSEVTVKILNDAMPGHADIYGLEIVVNGEKHLVYEGPPPVRMITLSMEVQ